MKQFQVQTKNGNQIRHNNLADFINILFNLYHDKYKKTLIKNIKRSFLHELGFFHGGKLTLLGLVLFVLAALNRELIKKKLKEFSQHFKK